MLVQSGRGLVGVIIARERDRDRVVKKSFVKIKSSVPALRIV